jgi:hypothetical protein
MLSLFRHRGTGRILVVEFNPYQILIVGLLRPHRGPAVVEFVAEFDRRDLAGLRQWIDGHKEMRRHWLAAIGGFVPRQGVIQRESLKAADLGDNTDLITSIRDNQTRHASASSAPFKDIDPRQWTFRAVNAASGQPLPEDNVIRPALLVGLLNEEVHEVQQQLLDSRLMPRQLEPAPLALFGALYRIMEHRGNARATVVFIIRQESTAVYILGKEGVHTPRPVPHGLSSVVKLVRKEFALESDEAALGRLMHPDDELRRRARKLLRGLGSELRPLIDSYEMTTGQPSGEIFCAYLPPALAWLADPLVRTIDHELLNVDCAEWLPLAGLQVGPGVPLLDAHWLGVLSLAANLPGTADPGSNPAVAAADESERPWHVNCRMTIEAPGARWVTRRFLTSALVATAMIFAVAAAGWQAYVARGLRADAAYWDREMAGNRELVDQLSASLATLQERTTRINQAHALMRQPFPMTDFLMDLGRLMPPRMRIDRIEAGDSRVVLAGSILEPAEEASLSLGRYRETLRRSPAVGPLFSAITATSLQRERESDALTFEITLRQKPPP